MRCGQCLIEKGAGSGWEQGKTALEEETWKGEDLKKGMFEDCFHVAGVLGEQVDQDDMRLEGLVRADVKGPWMVC